ncbi:MAG: hypothetical protein Q8P80_05530 [Candidatus Levybacteria bacterium]|nr:hypothetical protein [Candidatus Levybacteria bacterium]
MVAKKKTHYHHLKEKWTNKHKSLSEKLWTKHKKVLNWAVDSGRQLAIGSAASLMLITTPSLPAISPSHSIAVQQPVPASDIDKSVFLISDLYNILPKDEIRSLSKGEEEEIARILSRDFSLKITAELDGKRINRNYGLIGAEQHLARYPGDTMDSHFDNEEDAKLYWSSGMAPGLGAWGYFSYGEMTDADKTREKYYIAVQTFLAPGFDENPREIINFFKYRKMLVVNPNNGKAMVVVVGDAGPAAWTGKHLGGSPEVMHYLERVDGKGVGSVLYFFIDDPTNNVPLGPLQYNGVTDKNS